MCFTVKHISLNKTKFALLLSANRKYHFIFKGKEKQTAAGRAAP